MLIYFDSLLLLVLLQNSRRSFYLVTGKIFSEQMSGKAFNEIVHALGKKKTVCNGTRWDTS